MTRNRYSLSVVVWLCSLLAASGARQAFAVITPLTDAGPTSANAKYQTTHNANVTVGYDATDVGAQQGTIKFTAAWPVGDFGPRTILFNQTDDPGGLSFGSTQGARFWIEFSLTNNSGVPWTGFKVRTVDESVPAGIVIGGVGSHRAEAHFHDAGAVAMGGLTTFNNFDNEQEVIIGGGTIPNGGVLTASEFFLHERNFKDANMNAVKREFTLVLTPIPEPSTVVLMAIGLLGLAWGSRRARACAN